MSDPKRPILTGYLALNGWAEDYSDWDGVITGPANPRGANLYWHDPIPMIEKRAYDQVVKERDFASQQWRDWNAKADALREWAIFAYNVIAAGADLMPLEQLSKWAGVRAALETYPEQEGQSASDPGNPVLAAADLFNDAHAKQECKVCLGQKTVTFDQTPTGPRTVSCWRCERKHDEKCTFAYGRWYCEKGCPAQAHQEGGADGNGV